MSSVANTASEPESVDGSFRPQRDPTVRMVSIDDEVILVESNGRLHVLNATASLLWECFDGTVTIAELADEIATEMDVARQDVLSDTLRAAQHFVDRGIVSDGREPFAAVAHVSSVSDARNDAPGPEPHVLVEPPNT